MKNPIIEARNNLATAHYYLNEARGEFFAALDAPDASPPGVKFNPREEAAHMSLMDAEQTALDAADELLSALSDVCSCDLPDVGACEN